MLCYSRKVILRNTSNKIYSYYWCAIYTIIVYTIVHTLDTKVYWKILLIYRTHQSKVLFGVLWQYIDTFCWYKTTLKVSKIRLSKHWKRVLFNLISFLSILMQIYWQLKKISKRFLGYLLAWLNLLYLYIERSFKFESLFRFVH